MLSSPSPELASKLAELWRDLSAGRPFWKKRTAPKIIDGIAALGEPIALLDFINLVHHEERDVRNAAEDAVRVLLPKVMAEDILALEVRVRESWSRFYWHDGAFRAEWPASWFLSTLDPNGRRRERAILLIESLPGFAGLPFVLLRLNDWVLQVRERAEAWVTRRIDSFPIADLIHDFPVLSALLGRKAGRAAQLLVSLLGRFRGSAARQLLEALPSLPARGRREAFHVLLDSGTLLDPDNQAFLLGSRDPFLGVLLVTTLRSQGLRPSQEWLATAAESSSAMLRRTALYTWADAGFPHLLEAVRPALLDPSGGIREFAQYWTRRLDPTLDLAAFYQKEIRISSSPTRTASAITGFHEVGGRWEVACYRPWLSNKFSSVRIASLRTFALACPDDSTGTLECCLLGDGGPAMEKAAFSILLTRPSSISASVLRKVAESSRRSSTRIRALAILMRKDKWVQLPALLRLLRDPDETFSIYVNQALRGWFSRFNRSWTPPDALNLREAVEELEKSRPFLEGSAISELESLLKSTRVVA